MHIPRRIVTISIAAIALLLSLAVIAAIRASPDKYEENRWTRLVEKCGMVMENFSAMPDHGIPEKPVLVCQTRGIFPSTMSGGLGI